VHTAKVLRLSVDLPVVIEIIDSAERIDAFLSVVDDVIDEGLATVERVDMHLYRQG
jgi:PII-like signaling protein